MLKYEDILFDVSDGTATITINRPEVLNAYRHRTMRELINAFRRADGDTTVGAIILTGAGDRAFSAGGDMKQMGEHEPDEDFEEHYRASEALIAAIRDTRKPVIAAVNGYAIGGGHVMHVVCDLSIASETAIFGQVGPRVGSFDAGFGSICLARSVGEKKAREIWYLCRRYTAQEALEMGLVNKVVPPDKLIEEARAWATEINQKSPTAIRFLKASFNADTASAGGVTALAFAGLDLYVDTDEAKEGGRAFIEKRPVDFSRFRRYARRH
jgi:naphthoate synthase